MGTFRRIHQQNLYDPLGIRNKFRTKSSNSAYLFYISSNPFIFFKYCNDCYKFSFSDAFIQRLEVYADLYYEN